MTRAGDKGREAENFTARFLSENGWPYAERRTKKGRLDQGDLTGTPGLMWEVKYLGRDVRARMAKWMKETDVQTKNARADFGILVVKPPRLGERQVGKFWALMRWDERVRLLRQAVDRQGWAVVAQAYPHSNARLTTLGVKLAELDRIPGHQWVVSIPPRVPETQGLAVLTLERIVPILHAAGYGGHSVVAGASHGPVGGSEGE